MEVNEINPGMGAISIFDKEIQEKEYELDEEIPSPILKEVLLPKAFIQICLYEKMWDFLNSKLGTLFDQYEEEDIEHKQIPPLIKSIKEFIQQKDYLSRDKNEVIKHLYATELDGTPLYYANATVGELLDYLNIICEILEEAYQKKKDIIVAL